MTRDEAVERLNFVIAHLWMIRTYLKHADEVQEDPELIEVPRMIFDSVRAAEPAREAGDITTFLRRLKGKLPKLRKNAEMFAREYKRVSTHTNFEMAATSYLGCIRLMEEIFAGIDQQVEPATEQPPSEISNPE
jgi:hypothetical protein